MEEFNKYLNNKDNPDKDKEKMMKERTKLEHKVFEAKVAKLNHLLKSDNHNFSFNIRKNGDHFEFDIPIEVLIGPKTRKFCADLWKSIMGRADIEMDFNDELHRVIKSMSGIIVTMKMNLSLTHEVGEGEVKKG